MAESSNPQTLEEILSRTVNVLDESKRDIFSIGESSRRELDKVKKEIHNVNQRINKVIDKLEGMKKVNQKARYRLMEVSRDIHRYTEEDIKEAYEKAEETSVQIAVLREKEDQLKNHRKSLEDRVSNLKHTVDKAENLISRMSLVRDYLQGKLSDLSDHFDDLRQKQDMALQVIRSQEEERKRVAREIHDGPAQSLANLVFRVEVSQQLVDKDREKAKKELEELKEIVRSSVKDVRKIIYDLRPMSLDDLGLIPTLKRYINEFIKQTDINVNLKIRGDKRRLPASHEVTIFRLIQEALNNIYKHAEATSSTVSIEFKTNVINLLIIDNGKGFNPGDIEGNKFGLVSMRERCNLLNGEIKISSREEKGTRINISIPVKEG